MENNKSSVEERDRKNPLAKSDRIEVLQPITTSLSPEMRAATDQETDAILSDSSPLFPNSMKAVI